MAGFRKFANAVCQEPVITASEWEAMFGRNSFRTKSASAKRIAADQSEYLLSHSTIVASVMVEDDPFDYFIKPEAAAMVNSNDDAWTNEVLAASYKTFIGGFNFVEHVQNTKVAKGHILDAILRKVSITPTVFVNYVDILVATDVKGDPDLIEKIRSREMRYMSMGCVTDLVICSYCGARVTDSRNMCEHLLYRKGDILPDDDGIPRRIAELCGHKSLPNGGVKFIEASWVKTPAFAGAESQGIVAESWVGPKSKYTRVASSGKFSRAAGVMEEDPYMSAVLRGLLN